MAQVDLVKGTLDVMILKSLTWGTKHGYSVTRWVTNATDGKLDIAEGALYPALHRLEKRGAVQSEWGLSENNRQARFYSITPAGRTMLRKEVSAWRTYVDLLAQVLNAPAEEGA